jgi:hypothetical protein
MCWELNCGFHTEFVFEYYAVLNLHKTKFGY